MKIKEMFKKITVGIGAFVAIIPSNVFAENVNEILANLDCGDPIDDPEPISSKPFFILLRACQFITIIMFFISGIILIVKKHKKEKIQGVKIALIITAIMHIISIILYILCLIHISLLY